MDHIKKRKPVDKDMRAELWRQMGARLWFPIDRFPIQEAFDAKATSFAPMPNDSGKLNQGNQGRLPVKVVQMCLSFLDMPSILSLAATCRKLRSLILPVSDEITARCIREDYNWMLPITTQEKRAWQSKVEQMMPSSNTMAAEVSLRDKEQSVHLLDSHLFPLRQQRCFPWWSYFRLCLESQTSLKNRRRIAKECQRICDDFMLRNRLPPKLFPHGVTGKVYVLLAPIRI